MTSNETVKQQFNKQANLFDKWVTTQNRDYLNLLSHVVDFNQNDTLLDVATGTGDIPIFVAPMIKSATGIDISEKMIEIANDKTNRHGLNNIEFKIFDVERLPFSDSTFTIVNSKAAFHHMPEYKTVFSEMVRCCKAGGKIAVCDIVAFEEIRVNDFFETFEKCVDISHFRTLRSREFTDLYNSNGITIDFSIEIEIDNILSEYVSHAVQTEDTIKQLNELLIQAREDHSPNNYWTFEEIPRFQRKIIFIVGKKQ